MQSGVTQTTAENLVFGAGTIHRNLQYDDETQSWNFRDSLVGATSGGSTLTITPELVDVEVDGTGVKVQGLTMKTGETATLETNFVEITRDILSTLVFGEVTQNALAGYDLIESRADIKTGDYWENVAFVGKSSAGKDIIVILENALCTSGLSLGSQNKKETVVKATFECTQKASSELDKLPYKIYYPRKEG